jgi:hypothetical protein
MLKRTVKAPKTGVAKEIENAAVTARLSFLIIW